MKPDDEDYDPYAPMVLTDAGAALLKAVKENDPDAVRAAIKAHASCDRWLRWMSEEKVTLLHVAVRQDCMEVAKILIAHDPMCIHEDRSMGGPPYGIAMEKRNLPMLQMLLDAGSDTRWGVGKATDHYYGPPDIYQALCAADKKFELFDAVKKDDDEKARQLLESGIGPDPMDRFGYTPLIKAAEHNATKVAKVLIEYGADPCHRALTGYTPLQLAMQQRNYDIVEMLGNAGASMRHKEKDYESTALDWADNRPYPVDMEPRLRDLIHRLDDAEMTKMATSATKLEQKTTPLKPLRLKPRM